MLKLDEQTRQIPVLTHTTASDVEEMEEMTQEPQETAMFTPRRVELMN
jgi:hypothetical protein